MPGCLFIIKKRKMKKKLLTALIILFVASRMTLYAQDDIQKIQEAWGMDKKELMRIGMELSAADSVKFWPVYDQYESERRKIGRERIVIWDEYVKNYSLMTNGKADDLVNRLFKNDEALAKLQQQYYGRFKTNLNAMQAARFLQIENYLNSTIRLWLQGELPVIGQLNKLKA
jgi:hypothetical protein